MGGIVQTIFGGGGSSTAAPAPLPQSQTDPYGAIGGRTQAATQLQSFMNNPSSAMSSPGYQQQLQQGVAAQQAAGAAGGTLQSGAQANALQSMGQNTFSAYYQQMLGNLGSLSGATSQTPASGAQVQNQSNQIAYNALSQNTQTGLGAIGMALGGASSAGLFSGFGGGGGGGGGFSSFGDGWGSYGGGSASPIATDLGSFNG